MRLAIFFACLCFLLLRGDSYAFAGTHQHTFSCFNTLKFIEDKQQVASGKADPDGAIIYTSGLENEAEWLISDDIVEEDPSGFLIRKYKLLDRFQWTLSNPSISGYVRKNYKVLPPFSGNLSYIYLTQGVLRI